MEKTVVNAVEKHYVIKPQSIELLGGGFFSV